MGTICIYAIKSAICLTMLFIPYLLLMRHETYFRLNRILLLAVMLLSLLLPLVNISQFASFYSEPLTVVETAIVLADIPIATVMDDTAATHTFTFGWAELVVTVCLLGMAVCFTAKLSGLLRMYSFMRKGNIWTSKEDGIRIYCHLSDVPSFSWMHSIVISQNDYNAHKQEIITHEKGHIIYRHSLDVCVISIIEVLQWFNPFVWILSSELRDVHEYEADRYVLEQGVNARSYQMLLIKKAVGSVSYAFANSFNHSLLKNRITMMMKKKSNPWSRTKVLYVAPAAMLALSAFATTEFENSANAIDDAKVSNLVSEMNLKSTDFVSLVTKNTESTPTKVNVPSVEKESQHAESDVPATSVAEQPVAKDTTKVYSMVEELPEYSEGQEDMFKYLALNLKYPTDALNKGIEGRVYVKLTIDKAGNVADMKVVKSVHPSLDAEAIRCIKGLNKWKPGKIKGKPVSSYFTIPVCFRLNSNSPLQNKQEEKVNAPEVTVHRYR